MHAQTSLLRVYARHMESGSAFNRLALTPTARPLVGRLPSRLRPKQVWIKRALYVRQVQGDHRTAGGKIQMTHTGSPTR